MPMQAVMHRSVCVYRVHYTTGPATPSTPNLLPTAFIRARKGRNRRNFIFHSLCYLLHDTKIASVGVRRVGKGKLVESVCKVTAVTKSPEAYLWNTLSPILT